MFAKEKLLLGIDAPSNNLEGWSLNDNDKFTREGYVIGIDFTMNFYILNPNGLKLNYSFSKVSSAIKKVNELLAPSIEFEYEDIRFPLVPLNYNNLESLFNKEVKVYSQGILIGTIEMGCDDVPTGVSVSDISNPILLALKDYLNAYLDD